MPTIAFLPLGYSTSGTSGSTSLTHQVITDQITGATATFTLSHHYVSGSLQVYHNGILQLDSDISEVNTTTFILSSTPVVGDSLMVIYTQQQQ